MGHFFNTKKSLRYVIARAQKMSMRTLLNVTNSLGNVRITPFEHSRIGKVRYMETEGYGKLVARMFNRKMDHYWASA
jgi:hypothetical protein